MNRAVLLRWFLLLTSTPLLWADTSVTFNEVMYHPASGEPTNEWVELRNQMAVDVDISGWSIQGGIQYTFASNTIVRGGGHVLVAIAPEALRTALGRTNVFGPFTGRLGNNGETLELRNNSSRVVDQLSYGVDGDWPVGPDGSGVSLSKRDGETASGAPANWTASEQMGGTPGANNFQPAGVFVPPTGLISYWSFNEASGAASLDAVGQNHATLGSGVSRAAGSGVGGALSLSDSTNAFLNAGIGVGNNFSVSSAITIEAALAPGWSTTNSAVIFRKAPRRPGNYRDTVMAHQPLAYWRLGDSTTTILDSTSNARNGVATAGVLQNQASLLATDPADGAVRATGAERITVPGFEKIGAAGYTVEFWVKPHQLPGACCQNLVGDGDAGGDYFMMNYILGPAQGLVGAIRPHFGPANTPVSLDGVTALQVNNTYHIVTTWDTSLANNNAVIYINGVANRIGTISRNVPAPGTTGNNTVYIGRDNREVGDGSYTYDEVALYNRPLSASDVAAHYAAGTLSNFDVTLGNAIQLAFQNDGNHAQASPPVGPGPVLSFGLTVGGVYSELDLLLDGQDGRPTLAALENGQLHHIAATYDSVSGLKAIYVDGVLRVSTTLAGPILANNGANAVLGNSEVNGSGPYVGLLDEVAFWNKALSPSEVAAHSAAIGARRDYFTAAAQAGAAALAFNEVSSGTNTDFLVELVNHGTNLVALEGYAIVRDGTSSNAYVLPAGQTLAAGAYLALSQATLGFQPVSGDKLYLMTPLRDRVLDAVVVKNRARPFSQRPGPLPLPERAFPGCSQCCRVPG